MPTTEGRCSLAPDGGGEAEERSSAQHIIYLRVLE